VAKDFYGKPEVSELTSESASTKDSSVVNSPSGPDNFPVSEIASASSSYEDSELFKLQPSSST
jgi:hypothetical protein